MTLIPLSRGFVAVIDDEDCDKVSKAEAAQAYEKKRSEIVEVGIA